MLNENEKIAIKQTISTAGWAMIVDIFKDEILEGKKPINFKVEGKSNEVIAREVSAREMAAKSITNILAKLNRLANGEAVNKKSYK